MAARYFVCTDNTDQYVLFSVYTGSASKSRCASGADDRSAAQYDICGAFDWSRNRSCHQSGSFHGPLILNKKLGIPVSVGLYAFDFMILIGQMVFRDREKILYGILLVMIYTTVMDKVLVNGKSQMQVKIISDHYEEINTAIQQKLDRGSTFLKTESGYLRKESMALLTVVSNREMPKLNQLVLEIDPKAFMIINQVNEVMGRGFTLHKHNI